MQEEQLILVDVRSVGEFEEEHLPESINIPLGALRNNLSRFNFDDKIVVFCRSGIRSAEAKHILECSGFLSVCNGGSYKNLKIVF